jgi:hypothetical protein
MKRWRVVVTIIVGIVVALLLLWAVIEIGLYVQGLWPHTNPRT